MTERMSVLKRKAASSPALLPVQTPPVAVTETDWEVPEMSPTAALESHTFRSTQIQRAMATPLWQANGLIHQEDARLHQAQATVQRQLAEVGPVPPLAVNAALQRQAERQALVQVPLRPQTPGDWVTIMRAHAQQWEVRSASVGLTPQQQAQHTGLQQQVAQRLAQGFRQDRQAPEMRYSQYASHLAALQRHSLSAPVVRGVLGLIPPGERPALQRAVDAALQREQEQAAQDAPALMLSQLQRQAAALKAAAAQPVWQRIQARRGGGQPLPEAVRRHLEQGLNHDLSAVRIHDDAEADKLAKSVQAIAFTTGRDIFFRSGQFAPNTRSGLELLAHEVTHTVQQSKGQVGKGIDPDAGLEAEAQKVGRRLARTPMERLAPPALKLGRSSGRPPPAPFTATHVIQRQVAQQPPSWKVSAQPAQLEKLIKQDMAAFLRQMLGRSLQDQTHYSTQNRAHPEASPSFGKVFLQSLDHLPISAASKKKVLESALYKTFLPDWVRLEIALTAHALKRTETTRAQTLIKALQAKVQLDHLLDFGLAVGSRLMDTVVGLYKAAKFIVWDTSTVRILVDFQEYKQMWVDIGATGAAITQNPGLIWAAMTQDVRTAW